MNETNENEVQEQIKRTEEEAFIQKVEDAEKSANSTVLKKELFLIAMEKLQCNIKRSCDMIRINRQTYYNWMEADANFATKVEELNEGLIDAVETLLQRNIAAGDTTAQIFFLKTKGKKRGYVETVELDHKLRQELDRVRGIMSDELDGYVGIGDGQEEPSAKEVS